MEGEEEGSAQYLTANCLLLTYFNGDAANLVDAHFDRALSCDKTSPGVKTSPNDKHRECYGEKTYFETSTLVESRVEPG